jgi:hypothetical protein
MELITATPKENRTGRVSKPQQYFDVDNSLKERVGCPVHVALATLPVARSQI